MKCPSPEFETQHHSIVLVNMNQQVKLLVFFPLSKLNKAQKPKPKKCPVSGDREIRFQIPSLSLI